MLHHPVFTLPCFLILSVFQILRLENNLLTGNIPDVISRLQVTIMVGGDADYGSSPFLLSRFSPSSPPTPLPPSISFNITPPALVSTTTRISRFSISGVTTAFC